MLIQERHFQEPTQHNNGLISQVQAVGQELDQIDTNEKYTIYYSLDDEMEIDDEETDIGEEESKETENDIHNEQNAKPDSNIKHQRYPRRSCRQTEMNFSEFFEDSSESENNDDSSDVESIENSYPDEDDMLDGVVNTPDSYTEAGDEDNNNKNEVNVRATRRKLEDPLKGIVLEEVVEGSQMTVDEVHKKIDSLPKIKKCPKCGKSLCNPTQMKIHYSGWHTGLRYCCPKESCEFRAKQKGGVRNHFRDVHEEKKYKCKECPEKFARKEVLERHIHDVHKKEKPYGCEECSEKFAQKQALKRHILTVHKKKKPYECEECGRKFNTSKEGIPENEKNKCFMNSNYFFPLLPLYTS
eukprot:TRINITY_DN734_c0_g2_i1.p1 TRINITY_DN734_c0_g2~~TRINITY_DN734_c0_g2_i1.p1  ORF type:complete len:355 (-),score=107.56 TRINITY_DN734_c0_g2_i1:198-1262(-)